MYQAKSNMGNKIEFVLGDALSAKEFRSIIEQLESLSSYNDYVNIIFDTRDLVDSYTFKIFLDEYKSLNEDKLHRWRIAFVSDDESEVFLLNQFVKNAQLKLKTFDQIEEARKWITNNRKEFSDDRQFCQTA